MARSSSTTTEQPAVIDTPDEGDTTQGLDTQTTPDADPAQPDSDPQEADTDPAADSDQGDSDVDELPPLTDDEYVARVRAGYGRECAVCELKMLGGQGLTLNDAREPIHRSCA